MSDTTDTTDTPKADGPRLDLKPSCECLHCWLAGAVNAFAAQHGPQDARVVLGSMARLVGDFLARVPSDARIGAGMEFSMVATMAEALSRRAGVPPYQEAAGPAAEPTSERDRADDGIGKPAGSC